MIIMTSMMLEPQGAKTTLSAAAWVYISGFLKVSVASAHAASTFHIIDLVIHCRGLAVGIPGAHSALQDHNESMLPTFPGISTSMKTTSLHSGPMPTMAESLDPQ